MPTVHRRKVSILTESDRQETQLSNWVGRGGRIFGRNFHPEGVRASGALGLAGS